MHSALRGKAMTRIDLFAGGGYNQRQLCGRRERGAHGE